MMKFIDKIEYLLTKPFFIIFAWLIKIYQPNIYFLDSQNILTKRYHNDNFFFIFKTKQSCDAIELMEKMNKKMKKGKVAFDIGANIGITSIWLAKKNKQVYAFEPEVTNIARLKENLAVNSCKNVEVVDSAVADKNRKNDFYLLKSYGHHSLGKVKTSKIIGKTVVKTVTLDSFCKKRNIKKIDVMKVDVEGFEHEVFLGAKNLLKNKKIKMIIFEISKIPLQSLDKDPNQILSILDKYNYQVFDFNDQLLTNFDLESISHQDFYAI